MKSTMLCEAEQFADPLGTCLIDICLIHGCLIVIG
jgi:hypothetical protein